MTEKLRQDAIAIFQAGVAAVAPRKAVQRFMQKKGRLLIVAYQPYQLDDFDRVLVVGAGKASAAMAAEVEDILGEDLTQGMVNVKYGHLEATRKIQLNECNHPVPDEAGLAGAKKIVRLLQSAGEKDLIICLLSGGGSALMPLPAEGVSLAEKQKLTASLLASGAAIEDINCVRKHISKIKGGQLARLASPAKLITLIISDVVGDRLDAIASGPTTPDSTTFGDAVAVLKRNELWQTLPPSIARHLERGLSGGEPETPKADHTCFDHTQNVIIASNRQALQAAAQKAAELGYATMMLSSFVQGEAREVGRVNAAIAREILTTGNPAPSPACILAGGETTVTIRGAGKGGRNQELALAAAIDLQGMAPVVILSAGTDGNDGPTDAAGAICDGTTAERAAGLGLDARRHLDENDSYTFFASLSDLLVTGPSNTNVMDLQIILTGKKQG